MKTKFTKEDIMVTDIECPDCDSKIHKGLSIEVNRILAVFEGLKKEFEGRYADFGHKLVEIKEILDKAIDEIR